MGSTNAPHNMKRSLSELPEPGEARSRPVEVRIGLGCVTFPLKRVWAVLANCDVLPQ